MGENNKKLKEEKTKLGIRWRELRKQAEEIFENEGITKDSIAIIKVICDEQDKIQARKWEILEYLSSLR